MIIKLTSHSLVRMKQRYNEKDISWMINTFKQALKLVKRNKIRPEHSYNNSLVIRWWELKFVYSKSNWEHILITCWKRCKI